MLSQGSHLIADDAWEVSERDGDASDDDDDDGDVPVRGSKDDDGGDGHVLHDDAHAPHRHLRHNGDVHDHRHHHGDVRGGVPHHDGGLRDLHLPHHHGKFRFHESK